eukprot:gene3708-6597_t
MRLQILLLIVLISLSKQTIISIGDNKGYQYGTGNNTIHSQPTLTNLQFKKIVHGNTHVLAISTTNEVYAFGSTDKGALAGNKSSRVLHTPTLMAFESSACPLNLARDIAVTSQGSLVLCKNASLNGNYSIMGTGDNILASVSPVERFNIQNITVFTAFQLGTGKKPLSLICGYSNCFAIDNSKTQFWAWGGNEKNSLCNFKGMKQKPFRFNMNSTITQIAPGFQHTLFLMESGFVYSCGSNETGENGRTGDGSFPQILFGVTDIVNIYANNGASYLLNSKGDFYSFGAASSDAIGINTTSNLEFPAILAQNISKVGIMSNSVLLWTKNGFLVSFGRNDEYQLGDGTNESPKLTPAARTIVNTTLANKKIEEFFVSTSKTIHFRVTNLTCFGLEYDSKSVCGGNGTCERLDTCSCKNGYLGAQCTEISCSGISSSNPSVCSGNGNCIAPNTCKCQRGFEGIDCLQRNAIWDLISTNCGSGCSLNKTFWENCLLDEGSTCYCNFSSPNVQFTCSNSQQVTEIVMNNVGLNGTISDLRNYKQLKKLDLSGNDLIYPKIENFLFYSIEEILLNNISNGQPASIFEFDKNLFPNLTEISLEGNSLCGPFPLSWKSISVNLKNHSKTLWCEESMNDACSLLKFQNEYFISYENDSKVILNFTNSCAIDHSKLKIGNSQNSDFSNATISQNSISYSIVDLKNIRSHIFLSFQNQRISQNISIFRVYPQFINYLNGTTTGIFGKNLTAQIKLEKGIALEIQNLIKCSSENTTGIIKSMNRDDAVECEINLTKDNSVHSGGLIDLSFSNAQLSASPLYVVLFEPKGFNLSSSLGYSNYPNEIKIQTDMDIARFTRHEIVLIANETTIIPNEPLIVTSPIIEGYLSFSTKNYFKSIYKSGQYWDAFPTINPTHVTTFGIHSNNGDINNSPYLVFRLNFNDSGDYFLFHDSNVVSGDVKFYVGLDASNATEVIATEATTGFFPSGNQKEKAPKVYIPNKGINYLNFWKGNGSIEIKRITLFKTDSQSALNLLEGETVLSNYDNFNALINIKQAGVSKVDLVWRNSQNFADVLDISSNSLKYSTVEIAPIFGSHPHGAIVNDNFTLTIYSNVSSSEYNGLVKFYCKSGNSTFEASHNFGNIQCYLNFDNSTQYTDITVIAKHTITNEELVVSTESVRVYLYEHIEQPRITPLANSNLINSSKITILTSNDLPIEFSRIYCKHIIDSDEIMYYKAVRVDSRRASCQIVIPRIKQVNIEQSFIGIWVNTSTNFGNSGFYLTKQNLSHLVIHEPISTDLSNVIFGNQFPVQFLLNMTKIDTPYTFNISIGGNSTVYQDTNCTSTENCQLKEIKVSEIPAIIHVNLQIRDGFSEVNFKSEYHYYVQNMTLKTRSPDPFILDPYKRGRSVGFFSDEKFNEDFEFYCIDHRFPKTFKAYIGNGVAICVTDGRDSVEVMNLEVLIKSDISELNNSVVVPIVPVNFEALRLSPVYIEKSDNVTFTILKNDTTNFIVPLKYRSENYHLRSYIVDTWPEIQLTGPPTSRFCVLNDTQTTCTNGLTIDDFSTKDVYYIYFTLKKNREKPFKSYVDIRTPVLVYKSIDMDVYPHGSLLGTNLSFIVHFVSSTLSIDSRITDIEYYCNVAQNNQFYAAEKIDETKMNCSIPYLGLNELQISPYIRIPKISNDFILVSQNISTVVYINQTILSFKYPTKPLYYTNQKTEIISFEITTELPTNLFQHLKCSLDTNEQYESTIELASTIGNNTYVFNCTIKKSSPGRFSAFIGYVEGNEKFSLSSNTIDFVFTGKYTFTGLSPAVGVTNTTNELRIISTFPSNNYGNVEFITKFGFSSDPYHNQTIQTNYTSNGANFDFNTQLFIEYPNIYVISMFIKAFGKELEVLPPVIYKIIDSNFFTPNHGLISGGEMVKILQPKSGNTEIVIGNAFNVDHFFNCTFISSQLVCITPTFNSTFPAFKSYPLFYHENGEILSARFILYEKRKIISVHPTIIPFSTKNPKFSLNITIDKAAEFQEGSLIIKLVNVGNVKDIEYGELNNSIIQTNELNFDNVVVSDYEVKLNYKNTESLAFNEQFTFTENSKNLTFVDVDSTISFTACKNIFNVNETNSIELVRNSPINSKLSSFVKCKLGNKLLPTMKISDTRFICNVSSIFAGVNQISLWYVNSDALNNEMLISPNSLTVVFVDKIEIISISPSTSIIGTPTVVTLSTNFYEDIYQGNVSYRCKYSEEFSVPTLQGNGKFSCTVQTILQTARTEKILLQLKSNDCDEWIDFSKNSIDYTLRKEVKIIDVNPFSKKYTIVETTFDFQVALQLDFGSSVVNEKGLFCKYNATVDSFHFSETIVEGKYVKCNISKSNLTNPIENIHVSLALKTSQNSTNELSNRIKFVFFKEPLSMNFTIFNPQTQNFEIDLPNFDPGFDYKLVFDEFGTTTNNLAFSCSKSGKLICKPVFNQLMEVFQPSTFNLQLFVAQNYQSLLLNMFPVVYYRQDIKIISVTPFIASYLTNSKIPVDLTLLIDHKLNSNFKYVCLDSFSKRVLSSVSRISYPTGNQTFVSCKIKGNGKTEKIDLTVAMIYNGTNYEMTTKGTFQFIEKIDIDNFYGFKSGLTKLSFNFPTALPTAYKNDYEISFKYLDFSTLKDLDCKHNLITGKYDCITPAISYPTNVQFSIYIDGKFSIALNPHFKYVPVPSISKVIPSRLVDIFSTGKTIKLQSSSFVGNVQRSQYKIQYVELNEIEDCLMNEVHEISCPISKATTNVGNEITMKLSIDGENFEQIDKKLYLYTNDVNSDKSILLSPSSLTPSIVQSSNQTNITIQMDIPKTIVLPIQNAFVRFQGKYTTIVVVGLIENDKIICEVPSFAKSDLTYPLNLLVDVSLDGVQFFGQKQTIQIAPFEKVDFIPKSFTQNERIRFSFHQFPYLKLTENEVLFMKLKSNLKTIEFNCSTGMSICDSSEYDLPLGNDAYSVELYVKKEFEESRIYVPLTKEKISVYPKPIINFQKKRLSREMKNMVCITGTGISHMKESIKIRGYFEGNYISAKVVVQNDRIGFIFPRINKPIKRSITGGNQLEISYSGINFEVFAQNIELIDSFSFNQIAILNPYITGNTFSFQNTTLNLLGTNLNGSLIIKITNQLFSYSTSLVNYESSRIEVIIPEFKFYSPIYPFSFPVSATMGISKDDGNDFETQPLTITDKFSNIFLVGILPTLGSRISRNITMKGANFGFVVQCEIKDKNSNLLKRVDIINTGEEIFCPFEYQSSFNLHDEIYFNLLSKFNDTSDAQKFSLVQDPFPKDIFPSSGPAAGNYTSLVTGNFDTRFESMFLRVASVTAIDTCKILNSTALECRVIAHADSSEKFELSYNRIEWYATASNFTYLPCEPGYGTSSYSEPCSLCQPGQFKASRDIEVCTNCPANTYSENYGSTNCTSCPNKMKSPGTTTGLKSSSQCVCVNNTMVHPTTGICVDCPTGAICSPENVTFPKSQKGWWFSRENITIFYQCNPTERCLPDSPDNCTIGYEGLRCGRCADGYYKSKLVCKECNERAITFITLAAAICIAIMIIIAKCLRMKFKRPYASDEEDEDEDGGAKNLVIDIGLQKLLNVVLPILTVVLIIGSNFVVISMFIFDVFIRRSKAKKKMKLKRKIKEQELLKKQKLESVLDDLHGNVAMHNDEMVPWETEHDFIFTILFEQDSDVEDTSKSINEILEDIFSYQRAKRNVLDFGENVKNKGLKFAKKLKIEESRFEALSPLNSPRGIKKKLTPEKKIMKMPNGFLIKSEYRGNVRHIGTSDGYHRNRFAIDSTRIKEVKEVKEVIEIE